MLVVATERTSPGCVKGVVASVESPRACGNRHVTIRLQPAQQAALRVACVAPVGHRISPQACPEAWPQRSPSHALRRQGFPHGSCKTSMMRISRLVHSLGSRTSTVNETCGQRQSVILGLLKFLVVQPSWGVRSDSPVSTSVPQQAHPQTIHGTRLLEGSRSEVRSLGMPLRIPIRCRSTCFTTRHLRPDLSWAVASKAPARGVPPGTGVR